jgi:hypothetical protein
MVGLCTSEAPTAKALAAVGLFMWVRVMDLVGPAKF